jgi:phosphonate transport system substrate-binding protein
MATQIEAMRAGRLHIAGFNTGSVPLAVNCAGFRPLAMMADKEGTFGYEMEIIVRADSAYESVEDLKGAKFAFTSPTSNSGYKAPTTILKREFGITPKEDFKTSFSGNHENSVINVSLGDYDGAAVANIVTDRVYASEDSGVDRDDIRVLYRSETFPTTGFGVAHNLEPELAATIKEAFLSFDWEGTDMTQEFEDSDQFIPIDYRQHWKVIRQIDDQFGEDYACR